MVGEGYEVCFIPNFISCVYFHVRHMIEITGPSSLLLSPFPPLYPFSAFISENRTEEGCLRRGTGECLLHIIPLMAVIFRGQCNMALKSPLSSKRRLYAYWMSCMTYSLKRGNPLSFKIILGDTKLHGMAQGNLTSCISKKCDKL